MFNKIVTCLPKPLLKTVQQLQTQYQDFRLYRLGSYALNRFTPRKGYQLQQHLAYGLKARQRLDLYRSERAHAKQPLVVFVHGGAWQTGDKKDYRFLGQSLASAGFDVAVLNYHLAPTHIFPSSVQDLQLALQFLQAQQESLGISTQQLILLGHSAGAFNIMSYLYHPQPLNTLAQTKICAVIGLAGPYHFDYLGDALCEVAFDRKIPYTEVMPVGFVQSNAIRHYLLSAAKDQTVKASNAQDMHAALKAVGNHSEMIEIAHTGHVTLVGSLSHWFSRYFQTKTQLLRVLHESIAD